MRSWHELFRTANLGGKDETMAKVDSRESLAAPGAIAGMAAVRCDVAAPVITGAELLRNGLENVTITGR